MIDNRIKQAITNYFDVQRDYNYLGMLSNKRINPNDIRMLNNNHIRIFSVGGRIEKNGEVIATITKRYASRKTNGTYRELKPMITYLNKNV